MPEMVFRSVAATAVLAAVGLFNPGAARAADLGGNCCADLEERVAELEATTVRKGNRKVSLTVSGYVSHHVTFWDDGVQNDMYVGDGGNYGSRWRFVGTAKITPTITAGFLYEFGMSNNQLENFNQLNGGDDRTESLTIRDTTVWLRHSQLGMIKVGHGSTATDNLVLIDLGGVAATPDMSLFMGGFILRGNNGLLAGAANVTWQSAIRGIESFDTNRRNHVMYESPTLHGFQFQAAYGEDNFWDVALRYAGEFNGIRIAGGIGRSEDSEFNGSAQLLNPAGRSCTVFPFNTTGLGSFCDLKAETVYASGSILHVDTGLFLTGAYANRHLTGSNMNFLATGQQKYSGPDNEMFYLTGGLSKNYFGLGRTVLWVDWSRHTGGLAQASFLGINTTSQTNVATCINGAVLQGTGAVLLAGDAGANCNSTVTAWGIGIQQTIDAAAMTLFATYHQFSLSTDALIGNSSSLSNRNGGVNDFSQIVVGTKIEF